MPLLQVLSRTASTWFDSAPCREAAESSLNAHISIADLNSSALQQHSSHSHPYRPASGEQTCRGMHQYREPLVYQARPCFHHSIRAFSTLSLQTRFSHRLPERLLLARRSDRSRTCGPIMGCCSFCTFRMATELALINPYHRCGRSLIDSQLENLSRTRWSNTWYIFDCAGGGAAASDIHGLKTGAQYPTDKTTAGTTTGATAPSTVPATAGYSGVPPSSATSLA